MKRVMNAKALKSLVKLPVCEAIVLMNTNLKPGKRCSKRLDDVILFVYAVFCSVVAIGYNFFSGAFDGFLYSLFWSVGPKKK